jgi:hypothetical protein
LKLTITSTNQLTRIDGVDVRVWDGVTEEGVACKVFVHRLRVDRGKDSSEFERELKEELQPGSHVDLRYIF